jgi:hypothetical protein
MFRQIIYVQYEKHLTYSRWHHPLKQMSKSNLNKYNVICNSKTPIFKETDIRRFYIAIIS